jgi:hypothetical protein
MCQEKISQFFMIQGCSSRITLWTMDFDVFNIYCLEKKVYDVYDSYCLDYTDFDLLIFKIYNGLPGMKNNLLWSLYKQRKDIFVL